MSSHSENKTENELDEITILKSTSQEINEHNNTKKSSQSHTSIPANTSESISLKKKDFYLIGLLSFTLVFLANLPLFLLVFKHWDHSKNWFHSALWVLIDRSPNQFVFLSILFPIPVFLTVWLRFKLELLVNIGFQGKGICVALFRNIKFISLIFFILALSLSLMNIKKSSRYIYELQPKYSKFGAFAGEFVLESNKSSVKRIRASLKTLKKEVLESEAKNVKEYDSYENFKKKVSLSQCIRFLHVAVSPNMNQNMRDNWMRFTNFAELVAVIFVAWHMFLWVFILGLLGHKTIQSSAYKLYKDNFYRAIAALVVCLAFFGAFPPFIKYSTTLAQLVYGGGSFHNIRAEMSVYTIIFTGFLFLSAFLCRYLSIARFFRLTLLLLPMVLGMIAFFQISQDIFWVRKEMGILKNGLSLLPYFYIYLFIIFCTLCSIVPDSEGTT